jgi:hypothetical protein
MENGRDLVAGITQNHLNAITCILYFYDRHLWNFVAPSPKRTRQILEVQLLLVKLQLLATSKVGTLTPAEIGYIESAIKVFTTQAKEKTPQSESRDDVLASCEDLREHLVNNLIHIKK